MPMPSPKYRSAGSLKKLGTDVKGICGTFSALALDWPESGAAPQEPMLSSAITTTQPKRALRLIGASGGPESNRNDPIKSKKSAVARPRPPAREGAVCRHQPRDPIGGHRPSFCRLL